MVLITDEAHAILLAEQETRSRLEGVRVPLSQILNELLLHLRSVRAKRAGDEARPS
jgi:hypothetical protein